MKRRILLIDDDAAVRKSLGLALEFEGHKVIQASDGHEGLTRFYDNHVDIVLLDLRTPAMNGWDTLERITAVNPSVPIIIITGQAGQYDKADLAGAAALMEKPLDIPTLLRTIQRLVDESAERRIERIVAQKTMMLPSVG